MSENRQQYRVEHLHQPDGWLSPGYLEIDQLGNVAAVSQTLPDGWDENSLERIDGFMLPGMPNVHSHAHQRGLSGRAEVGTDASAEESFWTWRERMYAFANRLSPDDLEALAGQAYIEMVKAGFTTVGEFHYLHNDPAGHQYDNPAEMSERILAAADTAGIGLTLLPVLYTRGGIGQPPSREQRRFILDRDDYSQLLDTLSPWERPQGLLNAGIAPHSIQAVDKDDLVFVTELGHRFPDMPIHIHVAEQVREVRESLDRLGGRPGVLILQLPEVNDRWTFIHATHCDIAERLKMTRLSVVAGLCPTTEAGLGDGIFTLGDFSRHGGAWSIGTDSNSRISVAEELRTLAFGQRLSSSSLFILEPQGAGGIQPGRQLYDQALAGGAQSLRQPIGAITPGNRADLIVLDPNDPALIGHSAETVLDGWIFSGTTSAVRDVYIAGQRIVHNRRHDREAEVFERFRRAISQITT